MSYYQPLPPPRKPRSAVKTTLAVVLTLVGVVLFLIVLFVVLVIAGAQLS